MRHWAGSPVLQRRANVHSLAWEFAMRPTMVSLLTLLLLAGSHARAQVPGSVDPTDLSLPVSSTPPRSHVTPPLCRRPFELHPALPRPRAVPNHTRSTGRGHPPEGSGLASRPQPQT